MQEFHILEPNEEPIKKCRKKKGDPPVEVVDVVPKIKTGPKPRIIIKPEAEPSQIIFIKGPIIVDFEDN